MTMKTVTFPSEVADATSLKATNGQHASRLVSSCVVLQTPRPHSVGTMVASILVLSTFRGLEN